MLVALFPGQGSLRPGMGVPWTHHRESRVLDTISEIADVDVRRLLTVADADELVRTDNAQLATFALSTMIANASEQAGLSPDVALGHSLGEYSALHFSGILSLQDATRLVVTRGGAMSRASMDRPGSMAAVLGASAEEVSVAISSFPDLVVANLNGPGQVVISGDLDQLSAFSAQARDHGIRRVVPLQVGGAFHSPLMAPAAAELEAALESVSFDVGRMRVVANIDATMHDGTAPWRQLLVEQLTGVVAFEASVSLMPAESTFVEMGPGGVLAGLVSRIRKGASVRTVAEPTDLDEGG